MTTMDDARLDTQTAVANALGISKQAVSRLIKNRKRTGIPMHVDPSDGSTYFLRTEVIEWYMQFEPGRGPRAGIRKKH